MSAVARRPRLRLSLHEVDLPEGTLTIGRSFDCGLTIADNRLSRKHAAIAVDAGEARVRDLESRNGTYLNEQRLSEESLLRPGDRIRIGGQTLLFVVAGPEGSGDSATDASTSLIPVRQALSIDTQLQLLERARSLGHAAEIARVLDGITRQFDQLIETPETDPIDAVLLDRAGREIITSSVSLGLGSIVSWAVDLHRRLGRLPGPGTMVALAASPRILLSDASRSLADLVGATTKDQGAYARAMLEELLTRARR
jgi:pSer/pThr/pTyr-binding forkhead associated (FHA) protein